MAVEIRSIGSTKGLFATRDIEKNVVILKEDPLVCCQFSWNEYNDYNACHHCLRPLETAQETARRLTGKPDIILPYMECCTTNKAAICSCRRCGVEYCSLECRTNAELQYHYTLCLRTMQPTGRHPLEVLNEAWKNIHDSPESRSLMLIVRFLARIIQSPHPQLVMSQAMEFCYRTVSEDAELAYNFLGDENRNQIPHLLMLLRKAFPHERIQRFLTEREFKCLLALFETKTKRIGTSAIDRWRSRVKLILRSQAEEEDYKEFMRKLSYDMEIYSEFLWEIEGFGLFPIQSAANHSCSPNAKAEFRNNNFNLFLVAQKDIKADEEIFISYLHCDELEDSRRKRRKRLLDNYFLSCFCSKCREEAEQPDVSHGQDEESEQQPEEESHEESEEEFSDESQEQPEEEAMEE